MGKREKELATALFIKRGVGVRGAAAYMRQRGWSVEAAVWWLTRH